MKSDAAVAARNRARWTGDMHRYFESRQISLAALAALLAHLGILTAALV